MDEETDCASDLELINQHVGSLLITLDRELFMLLRLTRSLTAGGTTYKQQSSTHLANSSFCASRASCISNIWRRFSSSRVAGDTWSSRKLCCIAAWLAPSPPALPVLAIARSKYLTVTLLQPFEGCIPPAVVNRGIVSMCRCCGFVTGRRGGATT